MVIFVIIVPFLGVFVYVIARGSSMAQHQMDRMQGQQQQFDSYVRTAATAGSTADELSKLAELNTQGILTDAEFAEQKAKLLG